MNFTILAFAVLLAAPVFAENALFGHYGYTVSYPDDWVASPSFSGPIEKTDLLPRSCRGLSKGECRLKHGSLELVAMPKGVVIESMGARNIVEFAGAIKGDAEKAGLKAVVTRGKRAGFPSAKIDMPGHPQPHDSMIVIEGSKVYYRVKFNSKTGAKAAAAVAASLKEVAPHDRAPEFAGPR